MINYKVLSYLKRMEKFSETQVVKDTKVINEDAKLSKKDKASDDKAKPNE